MRDAKSGAGVVNAVSATAGASGPRDCGPFDIAEVDAVSGLDLGTLVVPAPAGTRVVALTSAGVITEVRVDGPDPDLSTTLAVFAAPRRAALWPDFAHASVEALTAAGMRASVRQGRFGPAVSALVNDAGRLAALHVIGIDGPGWMLRVTVQRTAPRDEDHSQEVDDGQPVNGQGHAEADDACREPPQDTPPLEIAVDEQQLPVAAGLAAMILGTVVRRGVEPYPPGTQIPLHVAAFDARGDEKAAPGSKYAAWS